MSGMRISHDRKKDENVFSYLFQSGMRPQRSVEILRAARFGAFDINVQPASSRL